MGRRRAADATSAAADAGEAAARKHRIEVQKGRMPTGLNILVLICAAFYRWGLSGSWLSIGNYFAFGFLNHLVTCALLQRPDIDPDGDFMAVVRMVPVIAVLIAEWCRAGLWLGWLDLLRMLTAALGMLLAGPIVSSQEEVDLALADTLEHTGGDLDARPTGLVDRLMMHRLRDGYAEWRDEQGQQGRLESRASRREQKRTSAKKK